MRTYNGSLRVEATVIEAEFRVGDDRLEVNANQEVLGSWPLDEVGLDDMGAELGLLLDGERVVVELADRDEFIAALSPHKKRGRKRRSPKAQRPKKTPRGKTRPKTGKPQRVKKPAKAERPSIAEADGDVELPKPARSGGGWRQIASDLAVLLKPETWRNVLSQRLVKWVIASLAVIGVALLVIFAAEGLGMIIMLLGMVALIIGALAVSEDLTAYSLIPGNLSETTVVLSGVAALVIGGILMVIG